MERTRRFTILLASAIPVLATMNHAAQGARLRKIWDFDTKAITGGDSQGNPLTVFALGFSSDGRQIAAIVGPSHREEWVLILDAGDPASHHAKLTVNPEILQRESGVSRRIAWSTSGPVILLSNMIVDVSSGATCSFPGGAFGWGFTGANQIVAYQTKPARLLFFDLSCQSTGAWELPEGDIVDAHDSSADRGLLLLTRHRISNFTISNVALLILDAGSRKVLKSIAGFTEFTASAAFVVKPLFAEQGRAFCGVRGDQWHADIVCSATDTGVVLNANGGWSNPDIRTAVASPRVVISDYSRKLDWIDLRWYTGSLRRRVVWNYRSGKELVRWKPKRQPDGQPDRFDISPDGEYIVEGGAGFVALYRIEP